MYPWQVRDGEGTTGKVEIGSWQLCFSTEFVPDRWLPVRGVAIRVRERERAQIGI